MENQRSIHTYIYIYIYIFWKISTKKTNEYISSAFHISKFKFISNRQCNHNLNITF